MNRARNTTPNTGNNTNGIVRGVTNNGNGTNYPTGMNGRNLNGVTMNNGGITYGLNANGGRLTGTLAEQIRALSFVKTELELYLDTHPDCRTALDYYYKTINELKRLTEQYENTVGPLTAMGNVSADQWHWVDGPWPWQQAGDFMREGDR